MSKKKTDKPEKTYFGRPRIFDTVEQMGEAIKEYFDKCDNYYSERLANSGKVVTVKKKWPYTVEGLCVALGVDRRTLNNYKDMQDINGVDFFPTIKMAKMRIAEDLVGGSVSGEYNASSTIFNLKNNFGYKDKQPEEISEEHLLHKPAINVIEIKSEED